MMVLMMRMAMTAILGTCLVFAPGAIREAWRETREAFPALRGLGKRSQVAAHQEEEQ